MRKKISVLVASVLSLSLLAACADGTTTTTAAGTTAGTTTAGDTTPAGTTTPDSTDASTTTPDATDAGTTTAGGEVQAPVAAEAGSIVKLGLGSITKVGKSKAFEADMGGVGQADVTVAAVGFDADGKVASIYIDHAQTKVEFEADGTLKTDIATAFESKQELKEDYGMKKASSIEKEWYEQIEALAAFFQGKTVEEIKAMKTKAGADDAHPAVPDEADLVASVTITVQDYIAVVEEAWNNAVDVENGADKVGLGITTSAAKSAAKTADKPAVVQVDNTMTAVAVSGNDVVEAVVLDVTQPKVEFDADGAFVTDVTVPVESKLELGDEYGMKKASTLGLEWHEQSANFSEWAKGKSLEEIKAAEGDDGKAADADLAAGVSVGVSDYILTIEEAVNVAR